MKKMMLLLVVVLGLSMAGCTKETVDPIKDPVVDPITCLDTQDLVDGVCVDKVPVCTDEQELKDNVCVDKEVVVTDTIAPLLLGVTDVSVEAGATFDKMAGVSAQDNIDGALTSSIVVTGTVDTAVAGEYTLTYTVKDSSDNETVATRTITVTEVVAGFVVPNGDFSVNELNAHTEPWTDVWIHKNSGTGAYTASIVDGHAELAITNIGTVAHGVQFFVYDRVLEEGQIYRITFDAKALLARDIKIVVEDPEAGWTRHLDQVFDLTTDWATYTLEFKYESDTITTGKFGFFAGAVSADSIPTTISIDNVTVTEVSEFGDTENPVISGVGDYTLEINDSFDPLDSVSVLDNMDDTLTVADITVTGTVDTSVLGDYTLVYTVTDATGNKTVETRIIRVSEPLPASAFVVANGDFSLNVLNANTQPWTDEWIHKNSGTGAYTATIVDGVLELDITALGTVAHGTQFFQYDRVLNKGDYYRITFSAKADVARDLRVVVQDPSSGYYNHLVEDVALTTEMQTFTIEFLMKGDDITTGKFGFFAGLISDASVATKIYIDDIEIKAVYPPIDNEAPTILNFTTEYAMEVGKTFDPLAGLSVVDNLDLALTEQDIVVTGTVDTAVAGVYALTYEVTDAAGNKSESYQREVRVYEFTYVDAGQIENGDFSVADPDIGGDTSPWYTWTDSSAGVSYAINDLNQLEVTTTAVGSSSWKIQFKRQNITLVQGTTYKITFDAMSDVTREIKGFIKNKLVDGITIVELTDTMTTYEILFTYTEPTSSEVYLGFEFGKFTDTPANAVITLDNIQILEVVSPTILQNGDMANGAWSSWWGDQWAGVSDGTVTVVDGVMQVEVTTVGTASWSPQIYEDSLLIPGHTTYAIEFDVKADVARQILVNFGQPLANDPYFSKFMEAETVDVTTEWTHIVINVNMSGETNDMGKLVFEFGKVGEEAIATTVYLENIIIYPVYN